MTLCEVAEYLRVTEKTILRQLHKGEFPGFKIGNQWRFIRSSIDDWMIKSMEDSSVPIIEETSKNFIPLDEYLNDRFILMNIHKGTKKEILTQLVSPLVESDLLTAPEDYINELIVRENIRSTGTGNGIAFPHISNPADNEDGFPSIIVGKCSSGTDFDSIDNEKVTLFFLLCTNQHSIHLELLSRLSRIFLYQDAVSDLKKTTSERELISILNQYDKMTNSN
jgi:excisionase family DNA binding protein